MVGGTHFNWDAAASAIPGTKKVLSVESVPNYSQVVEHTICEASGLEGRHLSAESMTGDLAAGTG